MGRDGRKVASMTARLGLTGQLIGQIFITPLAAFSLTYLLSFSAGGGDFRLRINIEMMPWIGMASLFYGMLALMLALSMGGFTPLRVIERGGWRMALGLTRHPGHHAHRFAARKRYAASSHGRLSTLVHERYRLGHDLWSTRGSLILLAIPFQVMLATIPLTLVLMFPEGAIHQHRQLELALLLYSICLYFSIRFFPSFARRYIVLASLGRKLLGNTLRISWAFPVLLLWSMGQVSSYIVQRALGDGATLNIAFEQQLFESLISASSTPESSFLNLLTALAVMPLAAFTTLAVLGGGAGEPPAWMRPGEGKPVADETEEQLDQLSQSVNELAAQVRHPAAHQRPPSYTPAVVQHVVIPVNGLCEESSGESQPSSGAPPMNQFTGSMVDDLDLDDLLRPADRPQQRGQNQRVRPAPAHNEHAIRGFDLPEASDGAERLE